MKSSVFPGLLDELNVATALHCSVATVKRERQRGRLGFTRIGGRIRYTEDQIRQYLSINPRNHRAKRPARTNRGILASPAATKPYLASNLVRPKNPTDSARIAWHNGS